MLRTCCHPDPCTCTPCTGCTGSRVSGRLRHSVLATHSLVPTGWRLELEWQPMFTCNTWNTSVDRSVSWLTVMRKSDTSICASFTWDIRCNRAYCLNRWSILIRRLEEAEAKSSHTSECLSITCRIWHELRAGWIWQDYIYRPRLHHQKREREFSAFHLPGIRCMSAELHSHVIHSQ